MTLAKVVRVWEFGGTVIEVFIGHAPPAAPLVRLIRLDGGQRVHVRDMDLEFAAELATILDLLDGHAGEFAAALGAAVEVFAPQAQCGGPAPAAAPSQHPE
ncbi:hypothetical protein [Nonomuraea sp. B1E8]|uniref:hypothetical protein n=1 Tax=unclassified Nonomuraea TaxID=2593643 RepID=UPI00325D75E5